MNNPQFKNVSIKVHDLDMMGSQGQQIQNELYKMTGQRTVPNVWINGQFLGGNDDTQRAYRSGVLMSSLAVY